MSFIQPSTPPDAVPVAHNTVIAGPATNVSPALPTARALVLADLPAGITGAVASVFGRTGAVVAASGDYSAFYDATGAAAAAAAASLPLAGGTMAGQILMGGFAISGLGDTTVTGAVTVAGSSNGVVYASRSGSGGNCVTYNPDGSWRVYNGTDQLIVNSSGDVTAAATSRTKHFIGNSTAPTVAAGAGAGTGGSPAASLTGTDAGGVITVTTGTIAATGVVATITFNLAYGSAPYVVITPANAATALLSGVTMVYVSAGTTTFVINSGSTGITAGGAVYAWNFNVIG